MGPLAVEVMQVGLNLEGAPALRAEESTFRTNGNFGPGEARYEADTSLLPDLSAAGDHCSYLISALVLRQ